MSKSNAASASSAPAPSAPESQTLDFKKVAELAKVKVKEVLAAKEYEDRYVVVTTAGQKIVVEK